LREQLRQRVLDVGPDGGRAAHEDDVLRLQAADKVPREALVCDGSLLYFGFMLKKSELQQQELEFVSIEALVPVMPAYVSLISPMKSMNHSSGSK